MIENYGKSTFLIKRSNIILDVYLNRNVTNLMRGSRKKKKKGKREEGKKEERKREKKEKRNSTDVFAVHHSLH